MTRYDGPLLATADGLRASLEQIIKMTCFACYSAQPGDLLTMNQRLATARQDHAMALDAHLAVVEAADSMGERALLPLIIKTTAALEGCMAFSPDVMRALVDPIDHLMGLGPCCVATLHGLSRLRSPAFRALAANHMDPAASEQQPRLLALLTDASSTVRRAARRALDQGAPTWWLGWFRSDPAAQPDLTPHHQACLTTIRLTLACSPPPADLLARLTPNVVELPDPLIIEFASFALIDAELALHQGLPLGVKMLTCPSGLTAACALLLSWSLQHGSRQSSCILSKLITNLPMPDRLRACIELLSDINAAPWRERSQPDGLPALMATAVAHAWPPGADPAPLLDAIDAAPTEVDHHDVPALQLAEVLPRLEPDVVPWERLIQIPLRDFPGVWELAHPLLAELLGRTSVQISAPLMRRLLSQGSPRAATWALERIIIDRCWDEDPEQVIAHQLADPRARRLLFASVDVRQAMLPQLRGLLLAEACPFAEAVSVMQALRDTLGGFIPHARELMFKRSAPERSAPGGVGVGPSPQEWDAWRALRRQRHAVARDPEFWSAALTLLPDHGWTEEDHLLLDQAWSYRDDLNVVELAAALAAREGEADLERLQHLIEASTGQLRRMLTAIAGLEAQSVQ